MANLVQTEANNLLNASFKGSAYTAATTPMMLRLMNATGTASSSTAAGTEVANAGGSTYAAQSLTTGLGANTASAGSITTATAITFSNMPAVTTAGVEVWDSVPTRKWWGPLTTSKTTALGDTLSFAAGSITATLS